MKPDDHVLIFCNGDPPSIARIRHIVPKPRFIACADGAANKALAMGYSPNLVVGDLDSFVRTKGFEQSEILRISSQGNTDFEKTLDVLIDRGFSSFHVAAFSGGRIDQTLANLQIAYEYSKNSEIILIDEQFLVYPVSSKLILSMEIGQTLSILPMENYTNVTTKGLSFELMHEDLRKGGRGISNRSVNGTVEVTVNRGGVMVFVNDL